MDFSLTREQEILRDTVREFAQRELAPKALALDEKGEFIPGSMPRWVSSSKQGR